ncbi:hypothetical protein EDD86DRAFT_243824 [Gorgonomyces haynaldii]|nr:hypothetical protein EDD86DRAFT_243824 [Gorgonomyces haynaldii]
MNALQKRVRESEYDQISERRRPECLDESQELEKSFKTAFDQVNMMLNPTEQMKPAHLWCLSLVWMYQIISHSKQIGKLSFNRAFKLGGLYSHLTRLLPDEFRFLKVYTILNGFGGYLGNPSDSVQQAFRFGWTLFLYSQIQGPVAESNLSENDIQCFLIALACFISAHFPKQATISTVYSTFGQSVPEQAQQAPWSVHFNHVFHMLCRKSGLEPKSCQRNGFLLSDESPDFLSNGLKMRKNAFEVVGSQTEPSVDGSFPHLDANQNDLDNQWMRLGAVQYHQFDWRKIIPNQTNISATPRRIIKTPARTGARLNSSKCKLALSSVGRYMLATPLSANLDKRPLQGVQVKTNLSQDPRRQLQAAGYQGEIPESIILRLKNYMQFLQKLYSDKGTTLEVSPKLYGFFLTGLVSKLPDQQWVPHLLQDPNFQRGLICLAFELTRCTMDDRKMDFRVLLGAIEAPIIDLCLIVDILINLEKGELWLPRDMHKRLIEIQERAIEKDLWEDSCFCQYLATKKSVDTVSAQVHRFVMLYAKKEYLLVKAKSIVKGRFDTVTRNMNLSLDIKERAWKMTEYCINNEPELKLIYKRHLDVIMLSSLLTTLEDVILEAEKKGGIMTFLPFFCKTMEPYLEQRNLQLPVTPRFETRQNCGMRRTGSTAVRLFGSK